MASNEFTQALINSARQGAFESALDCVPSLYSSTFGLSKTLWATSWFASPINPNALENINNFAGASLELGKCLVDYCKNVDKEVIEEYIDKIKILYENYDLLNDSQKGELIGYTIGRYGTDIFAGVVVGTVAGKGVQYANKIIPLFRNLRNANRICNFEAMSLSNAQKEAIIASSLEHAVEREKFLKNISIQWDKQNKHIPGKHNFEVGKGTILIESNELEHLIKKHAGKGQKVLGSFGEAGFKERIDFGKIIGEFALQIKDKPTKYIPTSKGIITYAKDGKVHVYPANPSASFNP